MKDMHHSPELLQKLGRYQELRQVSFNEEDNDALWDEFLALESFLLESGLTIQELHAKTSKAA